MTETWSAENNPFEHPERAYVATSKVSVLRLKQHLEKALQFTISVLEDLDRADAEILEAQDPRGPIQ